MHTRQQHHNVGAVFGSMGVEVFHRKIKSDQEHLPFLTYCGFNLNPAWQKRARASSLICQGN
jgi:hypothetical protein